MMPSAIVDHPGFCMVEVLPGPPTFGVFFIGVFAGPPPFLCCGGAREGFVKKPASVL